MTKRAKRGRAIRRTHRPFPSAPEEGNRDEDSEVEPPTEEVAAFVIGALLAEPDSEEAREIRAELSVDLQHDEGLMRALVRQVQTMRDLGALKHDEAHYLIGFLTERFTFRYPEEDPELMDLESGMRVIERAHGIDEDEGGFMLDEAPQDWLALSKAWDRRMHQLWSALLRELGEPEMAATLALPVFEERWAAGVRSIGIRAVDD